MTKTVTIFGAAGYIGNELCQQYLNNGYKVIAVDNFYRKSDSLLSLIPNENFYFYKDSILNPNIEKYIEDSDEIVNLAGVVGFPACLSDPAGSYAVNVEGCKNVIHARNNINENIPLFWASTGSVYGKLSEVCTEESPTNPVSLYGQHKLEGERFVRSQPNTLCYRFSTAYGYSNNMRCNLLINTLVYDAIINKCLVIFEGHCKRSFIEIRDFANSIRFGLSNLKNMKYNMYNVGHPEMNYTKIEIAKKIAEYTGCYVHEAAIGEDPDKRDYAIDFSKITSEGFKCKIDIDDGIKRLIKAVPLLYVDNKYI